MDVVSGGEYRRAISAGIPPEKVVFSGVGKTKQDLTKAIKNNIKSINVESVSELKLISIIVNELNTSANIALRVNPEIKSKTHPYLETGSSESKFGIAKSDFGKSDVINNIKFFYETISKERPSGIKGDFVKKVSISPTMGPGINVSLDSFGAWYEKRSKRNIC